MNYLNLTDSKVFDNSLNKIYKGFFNEVEINDEERIDLVVGEITREMGEYTNIESERRSYIPEIHRLCSVLNVPILMLIGRENVLYERDWEPLQKILRLYSEENYQFEVWSPSSQDIGLNETLHFITIIAYNKTIKGPIIINNKIKKNKNNIKNPTKTTGIPNIAFEYILDKMKYI